MSVTLTIDGISVTVNDNSTILQAAEAAGIKIPRLCYLKNISEVAACRLCMVEIEGYEQLAPACVTVAKEGMVVHTNSEKARNSRRYNLAFILSQHRSHCTTCVRNGNCTLQSLAADFNLEVRPFTEDYHFKPWNPDFYLQRDESKCVKCMRCVQICDKVQHLHIWDVIGSGSRTSIGVSRYPNIEDSDCVLCGQCVTHCPVGALSERDDKKKVYRAFDNPEKITVVQIAPAVRAAWAEHFGLTDDVATTGRLVTALKRIGFNYVFDTNFSADLTIMEEASELLERLTNKETHSWPMFTSCCPGWVRFVKNRYPAFLANLSTAKSPQQMFGSIVKSYFAEKMGIDPRNLFVVSIMPCLAKKSECELPNQNDACGDPDVDVVLTTRELERMLRSDHINPATLPESSFDSPLGMSSGAAVIFGASGGVMDAALRTAYYKITGENPSPDAFSDVHTVKGRKEACFRIPSFGELKVAVVSGLENTDALMLDLEQGKVSYDFVEVMACPGGCAGGGGQPIHEGVEMAEKRGTMLFSLDRIANIRFSHENPEVIQLYKEYLGAPLSEKAHRYLHTEH